MLFMLRGEDFHSLRGTFMAAMEGAGVTVHIIQLIVGQSRKQTMGTTAIYTAGERVDLRRWSNELKYSKKVMKLIESAPGGLALEARPRAKHYMRGTQRTSRKTGSASSQ